MSDRSFDPRDNGADLTTKAGVIASSFAATSFVVAVAYGTWVILQAVHP